MKDSVELTLEEITDIDFSQAVSTLSSTPLPMKASYWFSKIAKKLSQEQKNFHKARMERLKKYAVLDDKGELEADDKGQAKFENDDNEKAFQKEFEDLKAEKITVQTMPMAYLESDEDLKLPPGIFAMLDKIIVERPIK